MATCCHADEYSSLFGGGEATLRAWLFQRFGLRGSAEVAADMAGPAVAAGMAGAAGGPDATLLEVGGGLGEIQVTLLESGRVASATNVDLSRGWEQRAERLLAERGLADRVDRRVGDVVDDAEKLPSADLVVAHRVLCCYPYWRRLVDALAGLAERRLVVTLPVDRRRTRAGVTLGNRYLAWRGMDFRVWVHPVDPVLARFADHGLVVADDHVGLVWRTLALEPEAA